MSARISTKPRKAGKSRLSRDAWLARALEALAKEGGSVLTVGALADRLGVSRGSFYWHFEDRPDFVRQLVDYWMTVFTESVVDDAAQAGDSASERLLALMQLIVQGQLARYDIAVRAWAAHDPLAAQGVEKVDQFRLSYVRALFAEMGFTGEDLEVRTRTFVVYYSLESGLFSRISRKEQLAQISLRHALLTRR